VTRPRALYASFDAVPAPKGASTHILQTVSAIARVAEVDLLTLPGTQPEAPLPDRVRHLTFAPAEDNFLQRALEWGDRVGEQLLAESYDVVHVRSIWEGTPAHLLQAQRRFKLVYECNGLPSVELKYHYPDVGTNRDLLHRIRTQERTLLRGAQQVMTQSRTTRSYLRAQGASGDRVLAIPNGVDLERFAGPAWEPGSGPYRIVYVGTLAPWQGIPFLVDAVAQLDECDFRLRIVGSGRKDWRKDLEHRIRRRGLGERVSLEDPVPAAEVPALLQNADCCVAPLAVTERNVVQGCCPIKVLEYMAAGRPIIAARLPVVAEILTHEEDGLLYKPDKPRRLTEALTRLMDDPELASRLAVKARENSHQFTWERHNRAVEEMYLRLLDE
jgi:glycosyltransferase involved in cell wall biosynthesis